MDGRLASVCVCAAQPFAQGVLSLQADKSGDISSSSGDDLDRISAETVGVKRWEYLVGWLDMR